MPGESQSTSALFVTGLWIKPGTCGPKVGCSLPSSCRWRPRDDKWHPRATNAFKQPMKLRWLSDIKLLASLASRTYLFPNAYRMKLILNLKEAYFWSWSSLQGVVFCRACLQGSSPDHQDLDYSKVCLRKLYKLYLYVVIVVIFRKVPRHICGNIRTHNIGAVASFDDICAVLTGLDFDASIANGSIIPLVASIKRWWGCLQSKADSLEYFWDANLPKTTYTNNQKDTRSYPTSSFKRGVKLAHGLVFPLVIQANHLRVSLWGWFAQLRLNAQSQLLGPASLGDLFVCSPASHTSFPFSKSLSTKSLHGSTSSDMSILPRAWQVWMINQNNFDGSSAQRSPESNKSSIHMYKTMQEQHVLNTSRVHVARRGALHCVLHCTDGPIMELDARSATCTIIINYFWNSDMTVMTTEVLVDLQVAGQNLAPMTGPWPWNLFVSQHFPLLSCMVKWTSSIPISISNVSKRTPSIICRKSLMPIWSHPIPSYPVISHFHLRALTLGFAQLSARSALRLQMPPSPDLSALFAIQSHEQSLLHRFGTVNPLHGLSKVLFLILLWNLIYICNASSSS